MLRFCEKVRVKHNLKKQWQAPYEKSWGQSAKIENFKIVQRVSNLFVASAGEAAAEKDCLEGGGGFLCRRRISKNNNKNRRLKRRF